MGTSQWTAIYDRAEADEIAETMPAPPIGSSFTDCLRIVRAAMPGESETMLCNIAEALMKRSAR